MKEKGAERKWVWVSSLACDNYVNNSLRQDVESENTTCLRVGNYTLHTSEKKQRQKKHLRSQSSDQGLTDDWLRWSAATDPIKLFNNILNWTRGTKRHSFLRHWDREKLSENPLPQLGNVWKNNDPGTWLLHYTSLAFQYVYGQMAVGGRYTPDLLSKAWKEEKKTFQKDCSRYHALLQGSLFFTQFCFYVALGSHEQATEGSFLLLNTRCVSFMCWTEEACWYIEVGDK